MRTDCVPSGGLNALSDQNGLRVSVDDGFHGRLWLISRHAIKKNAISRKVGILAGKIGPARIADVRNKRG